MSKIPKKHTDKIPKPKSKSKSNPKIKNKIELTKPIKHNLNKTKPLKGKDNNLGNTMPLKRQTVSRCKSRPKSSLSNTFKKPKEIQFQFNLNDIITEEDMILMSEQTELELLPTIIMLKSKKPTQQSLEQSAATLIQKTWRGFKTRRIVKRYLSLYRKVQINKTQELTQKKPQKYWHNDTSKETVRSRYQISINMNINFSPIKQYKFCTDEDKSMVKQDDKKEISSFNKPFFLKQKVVTVQSELVDPMLRIAEMQIKIVEQRQEHQLSNLQSLLKNKKISHKLYNLKKTNALNYFSEEKKKLIKSRSQLSFGFLKVPLSTMYPQISKFKKNGFYSEQKLVLKKNIEKEDKEDIVSLDMQFTYLDKKDDIIPKQPDMDILSFVDDIENINTSDIQNASFESLQVNNERQSVDYIETILQKKLIDEFAIQLYLTDNLNSILLPFLDFNSLHKFQNITTRDLQNFIDLMFTQFRPSEEQLLKRLNQKINPTATELLKILRNQEGDIQDEFYELVLPETIFKSFRDWKDNEGQISPHFSKNGVNSLTLNLLTLQQAQKLNFKQHLFNDKKAKMKRFQKDLHAMYYKAVFNCLNQCIIETKCSYSAISGRSTIGPGELRVSLLDSNSEVSLKQISSILQKSKNAVMNNFKYTCPRLDVSNFESIYRFQDILMKQLHNQIQLTENRWLSFFDEHLEIAIEINNLIVEQLMLEATKQIHWMLFKR